MNNKFDNVKIKIFADGANKEEMFKMNNTDFIKN